MKVRKHKVTQPMVFRLYSNIDDAVTAYLDELERKSGHRLTVQKLVEQALKKFLHLETPSK